MEKRTIGIFTTAEQQDKHKNPVSFFGCDDATLLAALYKHAASIAGPGMAQFDPVDGVTAKRVGEISVMPVDDDEVYVVAVAAQSSDGEEEVDKPATNRKPSGDAGTWTIQSVIFSKDTFDLAAAKAWISDSDDFGNYGVEETETSYRFRQYDPGWFSEFRTITLTDGVAAVYGKIAEKQDEEKSADLLQNTLLKYQAMRDINKGILQRGLRVLSTSTHIISKGEEAEEEERFVLSMVLEPNDGADGAPLKPDTQDDIYSKADIRKAAHGWAENGGMIDLMHSWKALDRDTVCPVETYLAPCEFKIGKDEETVLEGSWMLGARIYDDELWKAAKENKLGAWSIGGEAKRTPIDEGAE